MTEFDRFFMQMALREAEKAFDEGEIPIGCVIVKDGAVIGKGHNQIEMLKDEENEAYENLPESLQDSEKGERMQYSIDALEEAYDQIDEAVGQLETAIEQ